MKFHTLTLVHFLVFISFSIEAQTELIFVCDSTTQEPISFATIAGETSGFYSHVDGSFPRELLTEEEYRVSCVGYYPQTFRTGSVGDTLFLAQSQVQLGEAVVKGEYEAYEIGYHNLETADIYFGNATLIFATRLESSNLRKERIEEVIIPFKHLRRGDKFTVSIFSVDSNETPGELILSKEVEYDKRDDLARINIANYNLVMPEKGVFVAISEVEARNDGRLRLHKPLVQATTETSVRKTVLFSRNSWRPFIGVEKETWNLKVGLTLRPF